jgi:N-acetylmuramoyl-L-alanine amidase
MSSIAKAYGFDDWRTIYNHADNADLRGERPNPNVLYPGDIVMIPEKDKTYQTGCATEQRHVFELTRVKTFLKLKVEDAENAVLAGKEYTLTIGGEEKQGTTDGSGKIEVEIDPAVMLAKLEVFPEARDKPAITWDLRLGSLAPEGKTEGAQARLNNLGYDAGEVSGSTDKQTKAALKNFQSDHTLTESSSLDDPTKNTLKSEHGC